jgi:hypothetical protein
MSRDGEIVGLEVEEGGRSCDSHDLCGTHMAVGDLVKFNVMMRWSSRLSRFRVAMRLAMSASFLNTLAIGAGRTS